MSASQPLAGEETPAVARLGRYRIVGELAIGGMAQILLGSLSGPNGFARPVVVKRILPHLAQDESFVAMFLEEARIAAGIRHPNVVHVEELAVDGSAPFLVMEYLEGESAACVQRRLRARGATLPVSLAVHIVSEACAGLHAAHELTDAEGARLNLVHRDVSPHNLFVTYDGHVKVLDFGVARVDDRSNKTEAGQFKGKFSYMSPEQCRSRPLDRRSDVFALGIVLYELTTGCCLFARDSALETMRAITEEMVLPPSRIVFDYPPELEAICLKALARDPADRFATAAEMRRALVAFVGSDARGDPAEALAAEMRRHFDDRVAEKRELLRKLRTGATIARLPPEETDVAVALPTIFSSEKELAPPRRARSAGVWLAGLAAAFAAVAGVASVIVSNRGSQRLVVASTSAPAATANELPPAAPSASAFEVSPPTQVARQHTIEIRTIPSGAVVKIDGANAGTTPLRVTRPASSVAVSLDLTLPGHTPIQRAITPDRDQSLELSFVASRARGPRTRSPRVEAPPPPGKDFERFE